MRKLNSNGFTVVEGLIVFIILVLVGVVGLIAYGQISSKDKLTKDSVTSEHLDKAKSQLAHYVTENKTIPASINVQNDVTFSQKDNQTAELCASFTLPRGGVNDGGVNPVEVLQGYFFSKDKTHNVYRDNVDFYQHSAGRNCYEISYAPINTAYEDKYKNDDKNWKVCDSFRQYEGRYTGQTIKGFHIGGSITTDPGNGDSNLVLADDVDAYDKSCTKIPVSDLGVGNKVELYIESFDHTKAQFVKAIKKTD